MILIMSHFDISPDNHARYPNIMRGFVETFKEPVQIFAYVVVDGFDRYVPVARIVRVEQRGDDLWGEVVWDDDIRSGYVHCNWWFGQGKVGLSSGYLSAYPHATQWDYDDEEDEDEQEEDYGVDEAYDDGPR